MHRLHRGRARGAWSRYGYDLLVESTHFLAGEGATSIAGATDRGNVPMAAAFARAGHRITQERIHLV